MAIVIREATARDLEALRHCECGVVEAERPYDPTLKLGAIQYYDLEQMLGVPHVCCLVATAEDRVVGCGFARVDSAKPYLAHVRQAYLGLMYVEPEHRGQGINGRIVEQLQRWCRAQDVTELRLDVYVGNSAAIRSYEKAGFAQHLVEMRMSLDD